MKYQPYETQNENILISTDPEKLQFNTIQGFIERSYWAANRLPEITRRSIQNSLCFGVYKNNQQVGFARLVTDYATYAWLCDVFIAEDQRGHGLGKQLLACIISHPELQTIKRWALATSNAHGLYQQYGFTELKTPHKHMERITSTR